MMITFKNDIIISIDGMRGETMYDLARKGLE